MLIATDPMLDDGQDTLTSALAKAVALSPDGIFFDIEGHRQTYREFDLATDRMANALAAIGTKAGETVVTILDSSEDVLIIWFGTNKLGAIWVPINVAYSGDLLLHQIRESGARIVICDPVYLERLVAIADQLQDVQLILSRGRGPYPACSITIASFDAHRGSDTTPVVADIRPETLAALLFTSGTTGPSKACMISHNYLLNQGRQQRRLAPQQAGDIAWTCLPMFHLAALMVVMGALATGGRFAMSRNFSITNFWSEIERTGATEAMLLSNIVALIATAPESEAAKRCFGQLRTVISGVFPDQCRAPWIERFGTQRIVSGAFGQTEANRVCFRFADDSTPTDSCGRPADEFEVRIVDDLDNEVPEGITGEIVLRPRKPNVMFSGYWQRPEETVRVWRNLWMHTGDLGAMRDGALYFMDRGKDYLRTRGENVSSFELERIFSKHADIAEVAVHAVTAQTDDDEIKVTAVLRDGATLSELQLCNWAIEQLPYFAVPVYYEFREALYRNPTGKILKYRLREEGLTPATWSRLDHGIVVRRR
ncbi:MAG: ATP-dependent acyl-CoA ligase [Sphingomonadales bacterium]|nr:MAG: ATP-dependent acyl-CoA ligase [Sphingomonadales bacterium]